MTQKNAHTPKNQSEGGKEGENVQGKEEGRRRLENRCYGNWLWVENPASQISVQLHFNNAYGGHHKELSRAPS